MRPRIFVVPLLLIAMSACTADPPMGSAPVPRSLTDVVVLGTDEGSVVVRSDTGTVLAGDAGDVTALDGSRLYSSTTADGSSTLETRDPSTGDVLSTTAVPGKLDARVASLSGRVVALMRPLPAGADPTIALPHARSTIVVADPTGAREPRTFDLKGNFEPEAFSLDDRRLFLIEYLPALAPTSYRVVFLDLRKGAIHPVFGRFKTPPERMPGIRLAQVFDPASDQLYTLYTNRPSASYRGNWDGAGDGDAAGSGGGAGYGAGYGSGDEPGNGTGAAGDGEVSFIHVLNLRDGWAYCAGLPRALWGRPATAQALAPSPDGRRLYIVDSVRGIVAEMGTRSLEILRTTHVDLSGVGGSETSAVTSNDGERLFIGSARDGSAVYRIDLGSFEVMGRWSVEGTVSALALSDDGDRLYAALDDRVAIVDASSGRELADLSYGGVSILHVATL
jgi:hypothetical protein